MKSLLIALILTSCATNLSPDGRNVEITTLSHSERKQYEKLGEISCTEGGSFTANANVDGCRNELRNKAAKLGATVIVIENSTVGGLGDAPIANMTASAWKIKKP